MKLKNLETMKRGILFTILLIMNWFGVQYFHSGYTDFQQAMYVFISTVSVVWGLDKFKIPTK